MDSGKIGQIQSLIQREFDKDILTVDLDIQNTCGHPLLVDLNEFKLEGNAELRFNFVPGTKIDYVEITGFHRNLCISITADDVCFESEFKVGGCRNVDKLKMTCTKLEMTHCKFKDLASFEYIKSNLCDLTETIFYSFSSFNGSAFETANVKDAEFKDDVSFHSTKFGYHGGQKEKINFKNVEFFEDVDFSSAVFRCAANFEKCRFGSALFADDVCYQGGVDFTDSNFEEDVWFKRAVFKCDTFFDFCTFKQKFKAFDTKFFNVYFRKARFIGRAEFVRESSTEFRECNKVSRKSPAHMPAHFEGKVSFSGAIFQYGLDISGCHFSETDFCSSEFFTDVDFSKCVFEKDVLFNNTIFKGDALFREVEFHNNFEIKNCVFDLDIFVEDCTCGKKKDDVTKSVSIIETLFKKVGRFEGLSLREFVVDRCRFEGYCRFGRVERQSADPSNPTPPNPITIKDGFKFKSCVFKRDLELSVKGCDNENECEFSDIYADQKVKFESEKIGKVTIKMASLNIFETGVVDQIQLERCVVNSGKIEFGNLACCESAFHSRIDFTGCDPALIEKKEGTDETQIYFKKTLFAGTANVIATSLAMDECVVLGMIDLKPKTDNGRRKLPDKIGINDVLVSGAINCGDWSELWKRLYHFHFPDGKPFKWLDIGLSPQRRTIPELTYATLKENYHNLGFYDDEDHAYVAYKKEHRKELLKSYEINKNTAKKVDGEELGYGPDRYATYEKLYQFSLYVFIALLLFNQLFGILHYGIKSAKIDWELWYYINIILLSLVLSTILIGSIATMGLKDQSDGDGSKKQQGAGEQELLKDQSDGDGSKKAGHILNISVTSIIIMVVLAIIIAGFTLGTSTRPLRQVLITTATILFVTATVICLKKERLKKEFENYESRHEKESNPYEFLLENKLYWSPDKVGSIVPGIFFIPIILTAFILTLSFDNLYNVSNFYLPALGIACYLLQRYLSRVLDWSRKVSENWFDDEYLWNPVRARRDVMLEWVGKYGTSLNRTLLFIFATFILFGFVFTLIYLCINPVDGTSSLPSMWSITTNPGEISLWSGFYLSGISFLTLGLATGELGNLGPIPQVLVLVEGFMGLFLMAYFAVCFARKTLR